MLTFFFYSEVLGAPRTNFQRYHMGSIVAFEVQGLQILSIFSLKLTSKRMHFGGKILEFSHIIR